MNLDRHRFIKHLITNVKCAVCQHPYQAEDIQVVESHDDLWVLSVVCTQCRTQGLIFAVVREVSVEPESAAEGTEEEMVARLEVLPAIDKDEVLDIHGWLREFRGDVYDLLEY